MRIDQVMVAVATPVGSALLYFLLAGEVGWGEAIACGITLAIVCPYALAAARAGTVALHLPVRGLWSFGRALAAVPGELWQVGRALLRRRPATGIVKRVPFRFGAFEPGDVGRRAAVGTAMSLAPNAVVLGMARESDELLLHQLVEAPVAGDRDWPS